MTSDPDHPFEHQGPPSSPVDPYAALGAFLTGHEAERLAIVLEAGETTSSALKEINRTRRAEATRLIRTAGLGHDRAETSVAVLRAIAGARSLRTTITPVWTMPGPQTSVGRLTGEVLRLIDAARISVTCSSYNFSPYSAMWTALRDASQRPELAVTVYVDATAGTPRQVADHLRNAAVFRTTILAGTNRPLVSHAKFVVIDHAVVLTTSANFSHNAENSNIELGLLVHDTALAESIEQTMRAQHGQLYERVVPSG
jgi:phosphatidylserine/phosphatidylglycerophosphate/cardiolipin synthase-like enzyme